MKELNNKQKIFCREYVKNENNATQAYMKAYPDSSEKSAKDNASRLIAKDSIQNYIKELQDKAESKDIMTTIQKKEFLTNMILKDLDATKNEKLKALDILNKMDGEYTEKINISGELSYEKTIREVVDENEY